MPHHRILLFTQVYIAIIYIYIYTHTYIYIYTSLPLLIPDSPAHPSLIPLPLGNHKQKSTSSRALEGNPQMVEADFLYQIGRGSTMEQSMYDLGKKKRRGMSRARTMTLYTLKPK